MTDRVTFLHLPPPFPSFAAQLHGTEFGPFLPGYVLVLVYCAELSLLIWRAMWLQDVMHMVGIVKQLQAGDRLQGGVFNTESVFQPIYQMLLALHTAAFCCLSAKAELPFSMSLLQQAAVELPEESLHPVLAVMLANTMAVCSASEADIMQKVGLLHGCTQYARALCSCDVIMSSVQSCFACSLRKANSLSQCLQCSCCICYDVEFLCSPEVIMTYRVVYCYAGAGWVWSVAVGLLVHLRRYRSLSLITMYVIGQRRTCVHVD